MDPIVIRPATLADMATLLRFEQGVVIAERPYDPTIQPGHVRYYDLEEMILAPHIELLIAEEAGQAIGSGYARIEKARHYLNHPMHAYLGFMYVEPSHRGRGVNQMIIAALQEWAKSQHINELVLDVYSDNAPAIRAYEKTGFIRHLIRMRKPVDRHATSPTDISSSPRGRWHWKKYLTSSINKIRRGFVL